MEIALLNDKKTIKDLVEIDTRSFWINFMGNL